MKRCRLITSFTSSPSTMRRGRCSGVTVASGKCTRVLNSNIQRWDTLKQSHVRVDEGSLILRRLNRVDNVFTSVCMCGGNIYSSHLSSFPQRSCLETETSGWLLSAGTTWRCDIFIDCLICFSVTGAVCMTLFLLQRYLRNLFRVMMASSGSPLKADADGGFNLTKHDVCEFSPFFKKGVFECGSHGTGWRHSLAETKDWSNLLGAFYSRCRLRGWNGRWRNFESFLQNKSIFQGDYDDQHFWLERWKRWTAACDQLASRFIDQ